MKSKIFTLILGVILLSACSQQTMPKQTIKPTQTNTNIQENSADIKEKIPVEQPAEQPAEPQIDSQDNYQLATTNTDNLIKICPDAWYQDQMPKVTADDQFEPDQETNEYLIINGQRQELEAVDLDWIKANCPIKQAEIIY
jgi:hypothetical protein